MSKSEEGSVAPKERVNIVYRPSIGEAKDDVELPLKALVLGDFSGKPNDMGLEDRQPIDVNKDNFNDVMKAQDINLNFEVADTLSGNPESKLDINLSIGSMKDFSPDNIAKQVPELHKLMELREALTALKGPLSNVPEFRNKIQLLVKDEEARKRILKELGTDNA